MENLLEKYKLLKIPLSTEEEREEAFEYVYLTNKLEGNKLTLIQTTQLLDTDTISGENISTRDILEQKGMYKALNRMRRAVYEKEPLTINLMKELNELVLSSLWKDDSYYMDAKSKGQEVDSFKVSNNIIRITKGGQEITRIEPLSSPSDVNKNMEILINKINRSKLNAVDKAVSLAKQIWVHQPFVDGNKRTGRLLINFLTMKEGYPLFPYKNTERGNYNGLLVQEYVEKKDGLLISYVQDRLSFEMTKKINQSEKIEKPNQSFGLSM